MKATTVIALDWAVRAFGAQHVYNLPIRALRLVEEAIELAQAHDVPRDTLIDLVNLLYKRPAGSAVQELGGVMLTATILAAAQGYDPQDAFLIELRRVLDKPPAHFAECNEEKIKLGMTA